MQKSPLWWKFSKLTLQLKMIDYSLSSLNMKLGPNMERRNCLNCLMWSTRLWWWYFIMWWWYFVMWWWYFVMWWWYFIMWCWYFVMWWWYFIMWCWYFVMLWWYSVKRGYSQLSLSLSLSLSLVRCVSFFIGIGDGVKVVRDYSPWDYSPEGMKPTLIDISVFWPKIINFFLLICS